MLLANTYTNFTNLYKTLGDLILINKKDRLKLLQKRFFNKVVKILVSQKIDADEYINVVNDENIDIKNIIVKNDCLRYN